MKQDDYWDSTVEMAARSFATYVYDKLNGQSDYLEGHANSAVTLIYDSKGDPQVLYAYPRGEERKAINAAFDELIDALKADGYLHQQGEKAELPTAQYQARDSERITQADIDAVQAIGYKSVNAFTAADIKATERYAKAYFKEMGVKSPFFRAWFGDWREYDKTTVTIANKHGAKRGSIRNIDTGWNINVSKQVFNEYNIAAKPYLKCIDCIVENAVLLDTYGIRRAKSINSLLMHSLYSVADIGNGPEVIKLIVEELNDPNSHDTIKRSYQLHNIEKYPSGEDGSGLPPIHRNLRTDNVIIVADLFKYVKQKDRKFKPRPVNPALLNSDGTPRVFYRGSNKQSGILGEKHEYKRPFYFSASREYADLYANKYKYGSHYTGAYYLSVHNPLEVGVLDRHSAFVYKGDGSTEELTPEMARIADAVGWNEQYISDMMEGNPNGRIFEILNTVEFAEALRDYNYDGMHGIEDGKDMFAVLDSKQAKSATDNIGTYNSFEDNVNYSDRDSNGNELTEAQKEFFKNSKVRDENDNLLVMYHNTNNDFTVFNGNGHSHFNSRSVANWFTDIEAIGKTYAPYGHSMKLYLNVAHPLVIDAKGNRFNKVTYHGHTGTADIAEMAKRRGYDGVIFKNIKDYSYLYRDLGTSTVVATFDSAQSKLTTNLDPTEDEDIRFSDRDYSYNALISKPDMKVIVVDDAIVYQGNPETRKNIVNQAIKNAQQVGAANVNGNAVVHITDNNSDVILSKHGLQHGLDRRLRIMAPITLKAGEILQHSIQINELTPEDSNASGSYVTIGMAKSKAGTPYVVRFVINQYTNELSSVDVLYAANAKKESGALSEPAITDNLLRNTDSMISISELLKYVNKYFPDILPESVLREFGYDARPEGKIGESALFSDRDYQTDREILADAMMSAAANENERGIKTTIDLYPDTPDLCKNRVGKPHSVFCHFSGYTALAPPMSFGR